MNNSTVYHYIAVILAILCIISSVYYWYSRRSAEPIYTYDATKDRQSLIDIFKQNWFWLTTNPDAEDAVKSFEHNIDTLSSSNSPFDRGNLMIKVYRDQEHAQGFIAYYRSGWATAKILYIGVNEKYRRRGYAEALMKYALDDLKKQGFTHVELFTRIINERAQNLYKKYGFISHWHDDTYITYERVL